MIASSIWNSPRPVPPKGRDQDRGNSGVMFFAARRAPGPRQLPEPDLPGRPGGRGLRPVPPTGQRRASLASGSPTTSSSPRLGSNRTAPLTRPLLSRCSTTASWYTTIHPSLAPCPIESSPSTRHTGPKGRSSCKTTGTRSGFATSGSVRSKDTTNHERHLVAKRVGEPIDSKRQSCDESVRSRAIWHSAVENV